MSLPHNVEVTTHNLHFHDKASVYSVSAKGPVLATSGGDNDIRIWAVEKHPPKGKQFCHTNALTSSVKIRYMHTLSAHQRMVNCVRFGEGHLASCSDGGHVLIWAESEFERGASHTVRGSDGDDAYEVAWNGSVLFVGLASGNIAVYRVAKAPEEEHPAEEQPADDAVAEDEAGKSPTVRRTKFSRLEGGPAPSVVCLQVVRAHADIVQGLSFSPFHSVLATQSRDRSAKTFHFGDRLVLLHKYETFGEKKFMCTGKSFYKRLTFARRDFLFLTSCSVDEENVVFVCAYPFRDVYARIGPFDSAVQRVIEWGEYVAVVTKRTVYLVGDAEGGYRIAFAVNNATFRPITDACVAEGLLVVSSLDGFLASIRLS